MHANWLLCHWKSLKPCLLSKVCSRPIDSWQESTWISCTSTILFYPNNYTKTSTHPISPKENQNTWANSGEDTPIELLNSCTTLSEAHCKKSHLKVLIEIGIFDHQVAGNYWQRKVDLQKEKKRFTHNAKVAFQTKCHIRYSAIPNLKLRLARSKMTFLCFVPQRPPVKQLNFQPLSNYQIKLKSTHKGCLLESFWYTDREI